MVNSNVKFLGVHKIMILIFGMVVLLIIVIFMVFYFIGSGNPKQFLDNNRSILNNSISEKLFVEINGVRLGMFIKGENIDNPIILYLHGGMPDYFLTERYPTGLEKNFTMVWWEQRGSGISYNSSISNNAISLNQLVDDTVALTNYLIARFNKSKIYLMGHSGGTFTGVFVIDRHPELYYAYIGIAQISDQWKSEQIALSYMRNKFQELNNQKMIKSLKNLYIEEKGTLPIEYLKIRDVAMHKLGVGTARDMNNIFTDLFIQSFMFSEYTISEKYNLWSGKSKSGVSILWNKMIVTNLMETYTSFRIPIYIFHGKYDYTCSYELSKQYFNKMIAPVKGFYTFSESAHSPIFEESKRMNEIMINDVLNLKTSMSDKN